MIRVQSFKVDHVHVTNPIWGTLSRFDRDLIDPIRLSNLKHVASFVLIMYDKSYSTQHRTAL